MKQTRKSGPRFDLTNQTFGELQPLYYIKGGKWHCKCSCGNELNVDTRNLKSGHTKSCGCLRITHNSKYAIDMSGFENEGIKVIERAGSDKYGTALWKCKCKICNNEFITKGSHIRSNVIHSCGCVHSLNEQKITKLFIENNISFATQYTFSDLKGKNGGTLRFDFAIFKDNQLSHLIEFQGEQHYKPTTGSWSDGFETLQYNDQLKKDYCQKHNIKLIEIRYNQKYSLEDLI